MVIRTNIEIEFAWLVNRSSKEFPKNIDKLEKAEIVQGYLPNSDPKVKDTRVRKKGDTFTKTTKRFLVSAEETGQCSEETVELSEAEFEELMKIAKKVTRKTRYYCPIKGDLQAEVDFYHDKLEGLVVVEVEFPNVEMAKSFQKPDWFGKEVTDSKGIYPRHIADLDIAEVNAINEVYTQKPHKYE